MRTNPYATFAGGATDGRTKRKEVVLMVHMSRTWRNRIFEVLFWASMVVGALLIGLAATVVVVLGLRIYFRPPSEHVDVGVLFATGALALFTAFLWFAAAITARFARAEISTSTAVNSADLTLQLDNRFNSDRALRIRHGAVKFLAERRKLHIDCDDDITPYCSDESDLWYGLNSDLMDLFNYFDWIGYLTSEEGNAIDREVLRRKLGAWIIHYYDMCKDEIDAVQKYHADSWIHLTPLYKDLIKRRKEWYANNDKKPPKVDNEKHLNAFLQREHVRSHRGFNPPLRWFVNKGKQKKGRIG
jgi:hypothetical protein